MAPRQILSGDPRLTGPLAGGYGGPLSPGGWSPDFSEADPTAIPLNPDSMRVDALGALRRALPQAAARYRAGHPTGQNQWGAPEDYAYGYGGPAAALLAGLLPPDMSYNNPNRAMDAASMVGLPEVGMIKAYHRASQAMPIASKSIRLYNPPSKAPRAFADDYKATEGIADEAGKLVKDIEGRPLGAQYVAGRRVVGGSDVVLSPADIQASGESAAGASYRDVASHDIGGDAGRLVVTRNAQTGAPEYSILTRRKLDADVHERVVAHETSHLIDELAGQITTDKLTKELRNNYHALNDPTGRRLQENVRPGLQASPEAMGYAKGKESNRELMAEAIRAYMADPNYLKSVAPETAKRIRAAVNANPRLSRIIQFNAIPIAVGGAGILSGNQPQQRPGT